MSDGGATPAEGRPRTHDAGAARVACHDCDLLLRVPPLRPGSSARCSRCGALLRRERANALDRALAFTLASLVLFVLANTYVFMVFEVQGRVEVNRMISGVTMLFERGMPSLALAILLTSIVIPGLKVVLSLYVLLPLALDRTPRYLAHAYRLLKAFGPWGMLDVYLLGMLVAIVNLTAIASMELGTASFCFVALMLTSTLAGTHLPHDLIAARIQRGRA